MSYWRGVNLRREGLVGGLTVFLQKRKFADAAYSRAYGGAVLKGRRHTRSKLQAFTSRVFSAISVYARMKLSARKNALSYIT